LILGIILSNFKLDLKVLEPILSKPKIFVENVQRSWKVSLQVLVRRITPNRIENN